MKRLRSCWAPYVSAHVKRTWSHTVLRVAMATALWSAAHAGRWSTLMASISITSLIWSHSGQNQATYICFYVTDAKRGELGYSASAIKQSRAWWLTRTFAGVIIHLKCAVDMDTAFAASVCVTRAAKSPATLITGSTANAAISAATITEDYSVEVWMTQMHHIHRWSFLISFIMFSYIRARPVFLRGVQLSPSIQRSGVWVPSQLGALSVSGWTDLCRQRGLSLRHLHLPWRPLPRPNVWDLPLLPRSLHLPQVQWLSQFSPTVWKKSKCLRFSAFLTKSSSASFTWRFTRFFSTEHASCAGPSHWAWLERSARWAVPTWTSLW